MCMKVGHCGRMVECQAFGRGTGLQNHLLLFRNLAISFTPLVSMPGEVKDPTQGNEKKPVVDSVCLIELVILISKLIKLFPSLAVISCKVYHI